MKLAFHTRKSLASILRAGAITVACLGAFHASANAATAAQKSVIQKLTSIFENSTPNLQYTYCENIGDGRGFTFGFPGFCSGTYDGTMFVKEYKRLNATNRLVKYIPAFEAIDRRPHPNGMTSNTTGLSGFPSDFRKCGSDPQFKAAQHNIVNKLYWNPSQAIASSIGAKLPITQGELYDTYINHGDGGAMAIIKKTNSNMGGTPKSGVDEKKWLAKFLSNRLAVLKADPTWREAIDRVKVYQKLLSQNNVNLKLPMTVTCYGDTFTLR